ncbi:MAG: hypothetical protein B1H06_00485 [Candidatus Cloacimonas sp. 4484_143]|nr:MAG: hypothetical protein B1H06_00485 [Candidatus Cloacimonas sp. 4484_143]
MSKYISLIIISFLISSCTEFTSPERFTDEAYYLTGILKAGKTVDFDDPIIIGKTIPVEGGVLEDLLIIDADVILYELDSLDVVLDSTALTFQINSFGQIGYIDVAGSMIIQPEFKYLIEAEIDATDLVRAETTVPKTISVQPDSGYITDPTITNWPEMVFEDIDQEHPIQIITQDNETFNLHAEFYCLENWDEAEYIFAMEENTYPEDEDEYESEADGSPRKTTTFYIFQPTENLINFSFYQYAFNFYGRYQVTVSSIDGNYLNYLYKPEGYNHGGIIGGVGYFGSAVSYVMYTTVIEE